MAVGKMLISPDIEDRLGKNGVSEVAASLWPVDCQTCGQSLGSRPPSLCVDDLVGFVMATLHHGRCRASEWNHQGRENSCGRRSYSPDAAGYAAAERPRGCR